CTLQSWRLNEQGLIEEANEKTVKLHFIGNCLTP
ncbi:MAG: hypothetical protein ACI87H_003472, partial [Gammaproteobacteria bacterium]